MSWKVILLALPLFVIGCGTEVIDLWPGSPGDSTVDIRADAGWGDVGPDPDIDAPPVDDLSSDRGSVSPTGQQGK